MGRTVRRSSHGFWQSTPLLNGSSLMAFLTCFGAAGYLLTRLSPWAFPAVVLGALIGGAVGAVIVARFLGLVLAGEREMDPDDYRLDRHGRPRHGPIPAGGTGEVVFSKVGARRSEAARSLGGTPIPRGAEVVITDYVDGKATVQPWAEFIAGARGRPGPGEQRGFIAMDILVGLVVARRGPRADADHVGRRHPVSPSGPEPSPDRVWLGRHAHRDRRRHASSGRCSRASRSCRSS